MGMVNGHGHRRVGRSWWRRAVRRRVDGTQLPAVRSAALANMLPPFPAGAWTTLVASTGVGQARRALRPRFVCEQHEQSRGSWPGTSSRTFYLYDRTSCANTTNRLEVRLFAAGCGCLLPPPRRLPPASTKGPKKRITFTS
jgi:hypothetical protein